MAFSVTGPRAVSELGGPVTPGTVSPGLPDILSSDTGDSHLQRDEPVTIAWRGGH